MCHEIIVQTTSGLVSGVSGYRFLGIPYGTARRFQRAEPARWHGTKSCIQYAAKSAQPNFLGKKPDGLEFKLVGQEDSLNLNLWTPSLEADSKLPVVIYLHGGAFQTGSNSQPERAGDRFAGENRMVFISVSYRLGVLGGLYLADCLGSQYRDSGSNAALDILLAIRWVKANAAVFGGDPENITLLGVSAGAKCIGALMTLEESSELFSKVILESGAMQAFRTVDTAREVRRRYLSFLPGKTPFALLKLPVGELIRAQAEFCNCEGATNFFGPVLDDIVFRNDWTVRLENGLGWKGKAVIGSGRSELCRLVQKRAFRDEPETVLRNLFGANAGAVRERFECGEGTWEKVLSDAMYRSPSDRLAERLLAGGSSVWVYSFEFPPACHGMGFHFMMRQESSPYCKVPVNEMASAAGAAAVIKRCVCQFILNGDPDPEGTLCWEPFSDQSKDKLCFGRTISHCAFEGDSLKNMPEYTYSTEGPEGSPLNTT